MHGDNVFCREAEFCFRVELFAKNHAVFLHGVATHDGRAVCAFDQAVVITARHDAGNVGSFARFETWGHKIICDAYREGALVCVLTGVGFHKLYYRAFAEVYGCIVGAGRCVERDAIDFFGAAARVWGECSFPKFELGLDLDHFGGAKDALAVYGSVDCMIGHADGFTEFPLCAA